MPDTWNVTAAYDKPQYNQGDTMTIAISGNDVQTIQSLIQSGNVSLQITAADGATTTINVPPVNISVTTTTPESVTITGVTDDSHRTWTIDASGLSATAVA